MPIHFRHAHKERFLTWNQRDQRSSSLGSRQTGSLHPKTEKYLHQIQNRTGSKAGHNQFPSSASDFSPFHQPTVILTQATIKPSNTTSSSGRRNASRMVRSIMSAWHQRLASRLDCDVAKPDSVESASRSADWRCVAIHCRAAPPRKEMGVRPRMKLLT